MTFQEILPKFLKGVKIRRSGWIPQALLYIKDEKLYNEDNKLVDVEDFHFDAKDFYAEDWEVVKYCTFIEALELLKQGKKMAIACKNADFDYIYYNHEYNIIYNDYGQEQGLYANEIFSNKWFIAYE